MYVRAITERFSDHAELAALCDPNPARSEFYARHLARRPSLWHPENLEEMIRRESIDRVIVTARDDAHADLIVRALHAGARVVTEKPLTINVDGAAAIEAAVQATGGEVLVTFNYRYSPRNTTLRRVIAEGMIGQVTSVDFSWMLDTAHGADYFRRWHRDKHASGGLLVHKASHHFDLVNWWLGSTPTRVFASGGLRFYGAQNARSRGMPDHAARGTHDGDHGAFELDLRTDPRLTALYLDAESHDGYHRDQDVFGDGITIEDNLAVIVNYRSGATVSYSLNAHAPWEGYRVAINGTEGRAELEVTERAWVPAQSELHPTIDPSAGAGGVSGASSAPRHQGERLTVQRHWQEAADIPIHSGSMAGDAGAHGGGDDLLLSDIFLGPGADEFARAATWIDGMHAIAVGIAGNRSLESGHAVRIQDLGIPLLAR